MVWNNNDGLYIKLGVEEGASAKGGSYSTLGPLQITEVKLDLTVDAPLATQTIVGAVLGAAGVQIPNGARIEEVELVTETAATSAGSATLNIGLIRRDRTTNVSTTGFCSAVALTTIDAVGERSKLTTGSTGAGAFIGTTLANGGYITAQAATAAFTAGKIVLRVYWYNPQTVG